MYVESESDTRGGRMADSARTMGVTVTMGAMTTMGAGTMLWVRATLLQSLQNWSF